MTEPAPDALGAMALLRAASVAGVGAVDTAPAYGAAEETVGALPWTKAVHTKIDPGSDPAESLASSLARLRRDRVDVLYLHDPSAVLHPDSAVMDDAHSLLGRGVGLLGASVYEAEEYDAALSDPRIGAIQVPLNVFDRRIDEGRLSRARSQGVRVYARSVLLQGVLLAQPSWVDGVIDGLGSFVEAFRRIAREFDLRPLDLALGWARSLPGLRGVVLGAGTTGELRGLVSAWVSEPLDDAVLFALRSLDQPPRRLCDPRRWGASR